jgi:hypothetical protein
MKRFALVLGLMACGGKIEETSTDPTTAGAPTPTTTATTVPPSPGSPGDPGAPTPLPPKDPTPGSQKVFTAQAQPGGRDHLMIFAADHVADSCIRIHLALPAGTKGPNDPFVNVVTPKEWGVEDMSRSPGAKRCGPGRQPPSAEEADGAKGTITFGPVATFVYPCTVDVHLAAVFASSPTVEQLDGDKIAVSGCQ